MTLAITSTSTSTSTRARDKDTIVKLKSDLSLSDLSLSDLSVISISAADAHETRSGRFPARPWGVAHKWRDPLAPNLGRLSGGIITDPTDDNPATKRSDRCLLLERASAKST
jgi:hypothetical protein